MGELGALRCPACQSTDFLVLALGVRFRDGMTLARFEWADDADEGPGYHVDEEVVEDPVAERVDGPVRALCARCLADLTDAYLAREGTVLTGGGPTMPA